MTVAAKGKSRGGGTESKSVRAGAPLAIDLYCGLGGWAEGFLAEGYVVVGFDVEWKPYPGQLVIQDVRTLHGRQFRDAAVIVASPPCQEYSYRAMPWKRAKALPPPSNELFEACFRIQREACEAAGRYIPLIVENVRGAQRWVGRSVTHYGSYHLWGDVPALMPIAVRRPAKNNGGSWFAVAHNTTSGHSQNARDQAIKMHGSGAEWFDSGFTKYPSRSERRKAASAAIAKIPFPLARHIARTFRRAADAEACA